MRLKKLAVFIREYTVEPRPSQRTVQKWPGAKKVGGQWYIDLDKWDTAMEADSLIDSLIKDPDVARCVGL